jgi:energy-coupling factor transport system permease protein
MTRRDSGLLAVMLLLGSMVVVGVARGRTAIRFYPEHEVPAMDIETAVVLGAYVLLLALPILIDLCGEARWKRSDLTM